MQLKKIYIKDYKNLKNFSLDFEKGNGLSILIGNNGSGKSNVLEAISGIFAEIYDDTIYIFNTDYELEYEIDNKKVVITTKAGKHHYYYGEKSISHSEIFEHLPSNVIAVYSGEDLRLWKSFYWNRYNSYLTSVYSKGITGKMGMYYVNKYFWNISLLTLILFMNKSSDIKAFLNDEIGINDESDISLIHIDYSFANFGKNKNVLLKAFIEKINSEKKATIDYSLLELRKLISNSPDDFDAEPKEIFNLLMWAFMPKTFKAIENISIFLENRELVQSLSEGEKKLILIKAVLEFIADENSILLLDEPDANIHEARKTKLYKLLKDTPNRDVVMTTHSPILAKIAVEKELIYLQAKDGLVSEVSTDKLNLVRTLASDEWNIMEAGVFLNSEKPLVLFEGKSDIDFVKRAIELLKEDEPKYAKIDADFLCFNGTGNASSFIKNVRDCVATKRIIVFFDRDDAGRKAMFEISGRTKNTDDIKNEIDYISSDNLLKAAFYPYSSEVTSGEFLLEDYFSEAKITEIIATLTSGKKHPIKGLSNLSKKVKDTLSNKFKDYSKEDFEGFKPLLEKIVELISL